jgi:hypothetical protein
MARVKAEMKCPYCPAVKAISGMTSHVRARHTEHYEEFKKNRLALVEKYKIVEGKPAPSIEETATHEPEDGGQLITMTEEEHTPAPVEEKDEPVEKQQSGSFLGSVGKALRDW